jgi:hypothetical protein
MFYTNYSFWNLMKVSEFWVVTYGWIDKHRDVVNLVGSLLILLLSVYEKGMVITCGSEMWVMKKEANTKLEFKYVGV